MSRGQVDEEVEGRLLNRRRNFGRTGIFRIFAKFGGIFQIFPINIDCKYLNKIQNEIAPKHPF
jgi:hypothetical protein